MGNDDPRINPKHAGSHALVNLILSGACVYFFYNFGWANPDIASSSSTSACWTGGDVNASPNYVILPTPIGNATQNVPSGSSPFTVNVTNNFIVWFQWGCINAMVGLTFALF